MVVGEIHARSVQQYVRAKIGVLFMKVLLSKLLVSVGLRFYQVIFQGFKVFQVTLSSVPTAKSRYLLSRTPPNMKFLYPALICGVKVIS